MSKTNDNKDNKDGQRSKSNNSLRNSSKDNNSSRSSSKSNDSLKSGSKEKDNGGSRSKSIVNSLKSTSKSSPEKHDHKSMKTNSKDRRSLKSQSKDGNHSKQSLEKQGQKSLKTSSKGSGWTRYKGIADKLDPKQKTSSEEKPNSEGLESKSKESPTRPAKPTENNTPLKKRRESKRFIPSLRAKSLGFPARRSESLESTKSLSLASTVIAKVIPKEDYASLTPEGGLPPELYGETVYDCCVFMVYCPKHDKVAISKGDKSNAYWFPFLAMKSGDSWTTTAIAGASYILSHGDLKNIAALEEGLPFLTPEMIHILRIQVPGAPKFITRVVYAVRISKEVQFNCCKNDKRIEWISLENVAEGNIEKLWGPEPFLLAKQASTTKIDKKSVEEYSLDDALFFSPRVPPRNKEEELISSAGFTDKDILRIYTEYVNHCFPSHFMTSTSFTAFMTKMGWKTNENRLFSIFKAFNYRGGGFLTFHELLLGLAAMDQATKHGGHGGALRVGYIFRYYDSDSDGLLDYADIIRMTTDIFIGKQMELDDSTIEKDAKSRMEKDLQTNRNEKVRFTNFMKACSDMKFRGTSVLFRSPVSIVRKVGDRFGGEYKGSKGDKHPAIAKQQYKGTCQSCKARIVRIAVFAVLVDYTGRIIEPKSLVETEGVDINWANNDPLLEQLRTFSRETVFNSDSLPNTILNILRQFDGIQKKRLRAQNKDLKDWNEQDRDNILTAVQSLCKKAEEIFANEPRCVKVVSPVYVLGDIHGNIADLMVYERNLWRFSPALSPSNYLFLGDFVDRGEYGIEVVCYLLSMKILAPDTFYMIRGNHEIRSIQKSFTFLKECNLKYGTRVGPQISEACNRVFDRLPICAIIDDNIFGAHGGIPTSLMRIDDLMKIPSPLQEPEHECPAAWEILWSDPMNASDFNELAEFMKVKTENIHGFITNTKRGTAFYFAEEAVDNFLQMNGLQYVVRAHEVMPLGYKFHMNGKVITVFSSSRYCGGTNEASALFCDNDEIRVVRFETQGTL